MGGIGSGRGYHTSTTVTTDEVKRIDVRFLRKNHMLDPGYAGTLHWSIGGEPNGSINIQAFSDHIQLNYRYRVFGEDWHETQQVVRLDQTPCNFGGFRKWLLCPRCNERVAVLYAADVHFYCRHCYQLPYYSQNQGRLNRIIDQKHKLGKRIFEHYENGTGWCKKKGMHTSTFNRLHAKYLAYDRAWCHGISVMLDYL